MTTKGGIRGNKREGEEKGITLREMRMMIARGGGKGGKMS